MVTVATTSTISTDDARGLTHDDGGGDGEEDYVECGGS